MRILFATDGSQQSNAALEKIGLLRLGSGDEIRVVSIIDMALPLTVDIYGGFVPHTTELEKAAKENADRVITEATAALRSKFADESPTVEGEVLFGSPDSRIVETAQEWNADLIVVGSHGYGRLERLLLGSVSDSVIHHAPCSVLVVRAKHEETR